MRRKISIDDAIAALIKRESPKPGEPFKVTPRSLGLGPEQSYENVSELLEQLEGPEHK